MDLAYWNRISENYQSEVLSVFDNDIHGLVEEKIAEAGIAYPNGQAADIGCGVGRFLPTLADMFASIHACDLSSVGIRKAKRRASKRDNIRFHEVDLSTESLPFPPVDFVLCVNVLIMPALAQRRRAWETVLNQVSEGGTILLVVPSAESIQMEYIQSVEAELVHGSDCQSAMRNSVFEKASTQDLRLGVHQLDGVRTKHYLMEELLQLLCSRRFEIQETRKLRYPPQGPGLPESWDWLIVAQRRSQ